MHEIFLNVRWIQVIKFKHHTTFTMLFFLFPGEMKQTDVVKMTLFLCGVTWCQAVC